MTTFSTEPVRVSVPATSANLGPGFDALGLALDLRDRLEAEVTDGGLVVEVDGVGSDEVPLDERHLVVKAMRAVFDELGVQPPGLRLTCVNVIPHARGLGSSSAAIVAGVWLARELVAGGRLLLGDEGLLDLAARIEGHPDNVAPALLGGFVIAGEDADGTFYAVPSEVDPGIGAVVFIPPEPVSTETARGLLPKQVPHTDAATNAGRAALLVAAWAADPRSSGARPPTACTRTTAARRCRPASRWSTRCGPTACPRSCRVPVRPCWRSPTRPTRCWPAARKVGRRCS